MPADHRLWRGPAGLASALAALRSGAVIGFPTDTVFGLGAVASDPLAVATLSRIKGRSASQPLIAMAARQADLESVAILDRRAVELSSRYWPGALTLIVRARPGGPNLGGAGTVGVRVPDHPVALALLAGAGVLATSSANRHGEVPARSAAEALSSLAGLAGAIDDELDGPSGARSASSILDLTRDPPVLIREGGLSARELGVPLAREIRRD
ncbi:MAG TPA: L-threonylcarbamoyladenylate synthase [Candidatus Dormibacteraeota bacterium]|nr:L-threonylcarbamoyladenylate synthase [Candidatus Dormibacteraeota bacterium]